MADFAGYRCDFFGDCFKIATALSSAIHALFVFTK
jgi:hypothetical protein